MQCPRCESENLKVTGYTFKQKLNRSHNEPNTGQVYKEYTCEACGNKFSHQQERKIIGSVDLTKSLTALLVSSGDDEIR